MKPPKRPSPKKPQAKTPTPQMPKARYNSRELTDKLRAMATEIHEVRTVIGNEGPELESVTKGEALAATLWKRALGYTETTLEEDRHGQVKEKTTVHKSEPWAIQLIWDRLEGKIPQAAGDSVQTMTAAERVRELSVARINAAAKRALAKKEAEAVESQEEN